MRYYGHHTDKSDDGEYAIEVYLYAHTYIPKSRPILFAGETNCGDGEILCRERFLFMCS